MSINNALTLNLEIHDNSGNSMDPPESIGSRNIFASSAILVTPIITKSTIGDFNVSIQAKNLKTIFVKISELSRYTLIALDNGVLIDIDMHESTRI